MYEPLPSAPVARSRSVLEALFEGSWSSLSVVGILLALVPPVGVLALWNLPSYPRDGKIAATVAALLWLTGFVVLLA